MIEMTECMMLEIRSRVKNVDAKQSFFAKISAA